MKKRIILICAAVVVFALMITAVCIIVKCSRRSSADEFTDVLGVPPLYSGEDRIKEIRDVECIEDSVIEGGTPQKIVTVKDQCRLFYVPPVDWNEDRADEYQGRFRLVKIEIFGTQYRFGTQKIGIGSTRAEVEDAYHSNYVLDPDRYISVHFSYDNADRVNLITLSVYA